MELGGLKVGKIAISEGVFPRLERLDVTDNDDSDNDELMEIEALPPNLQWLSLKYCRKLQKLPSFARLTSLRELEVSDCGRIQKIEGLEKCTRLERLEVESRKWEMPAIESLEEMGILRTLELREIEITICTRAVPDAAYLLNSFEFPPDLLRHSISNQKLGSSPTLVQKSFSNGDAILLCFVINCVYPIELSLSHRGTWAYIEEGEITIDPYDYDEGNEVEKGMLVRGEAKQVFEVLKGLMPKVVTS